MAQDGAVATYQFIEEWWGATFADELIPLVDGAPRDQLDVFIGDWRDFRKEIEFTVEPLEPGHLRPLALRLGLSSSTAYQLLLYAPSVVLNEYQVTPAAHLQGVSRAGRPSTVHSTLLPALKGMKSAQQLVMDGAIVFSDYRGAFKGPRLLDAAKQSLGRLGRVDRDARDQLEVLAGRAIAQQRLAANGVGTLLALEELDEHIYRLIGENLGTDRRNTELSTLARLALPSFATDTDSLVRLRSMSPELATFREGLVRSLGVVAEIPEGDSAIGEATALVAGELESALAGVQTLVDSHPSEAARNAGLKGLTISALGAGVGAAITGAMGNPAIGALAGFGSSLTAKIIETRSAYITAKKNQQGARAIWDVVLAFRQL